MSHHSSKGKGKSASLETGWSKWEWNSAGYWTSYRINAQGAYEYQYDYPKQQPDSAIPRSEEHHSYPTIPNASQGQFSESVLEPIFDDSSTGNYYTPATTSSLSSHLDSSNASDPVVASSSSSYYTQEHSIYPSTGVASTYEAESSALDTVTEGIEGFGFTDIPTPEPYHGGQENDPQIAAAAQPSTFSGEKTHITATKKRSEAERLDPRYGVVPSKDSRWFWMVGRVFMMLWTEPAGYTGGGGTKHGSHISTVWLNERAFSEIRRFVVVKDGHGSCSCLAIHTYGGYATLKRNLPDPENHAIIHTSEDCPPELAGTNDQDEEFFEELDKDPIKVNPERDDAEGILSPLSRINYSKIYCVEKDVRVLNIGMVDKLSMVSLEANSPLKSTKSTSGSSKRRRRHK